MDELGRGQRRELRPNAQQSGQDQAEAAEHLGQTHEANEQAGQSGLRGEHVERQDKLHAAGGQKDEREERLNNPQNVGHDADLLSYVVRCAMCWGALQAARRRIGCRARLSSLARVATSRWRIANARRR